MNNRKLLWGIGITLLILSIWYYRTKHIKSNAKYYVKKHQLKVCRNQIKNLNSRLKDMNMFVKDNMKMVKRLMSFLTSIGVCLGDVNPIFSVFSSYYKNYKKVDKR